MSQPATFEGRSYIFNALFVFLNLLGLSFLAFGFHDSVKDYAVFFIILGFVLILLTSSLLLVFRGRLMMAGVSRILVGSLFIVSGLIKANDPIGFSYKLAEYFEDGALAYRIKELFGIPAFSLEFLIDFSLIIGVVICVIEIVLGVLLIIGGRIKIVAYLSLFIMLFFTFLTWHTLNCDSSKRFVDRNSYAMSDPMAILKMEELKTNKDIKFHSKTADFLVVDEIKSPQCVTDCGCFGDSLKGSVGRSLSPKESFWKDIILLYLILWIFMTQWIILPNTRKQNLISSISAILIISFFSWVFGWYFPILFGIMILLGALLIMRAGGKVLGNYAGSVFIVAFICFCVISYVLLVEPLKDYSPFAIGNDLNLKMNDGVVGQYENIIVYKNQKTGKIVRYISSSNKYKISKIWEKKDWVNINNIQNVLIESVKSSISDFDPSISISEIGKEEMNLEFIQDALKNRSVQGLEVLDVLKNTVFEIPLIDFDVTDFPKESYIVKDTIEIENVELIDISLKEFILSNDQIVIVFSRDLKEANFSEIEKLKEIQMGCIKKNIPFIVVCSSSRNEIISFREKYNFEVPVFVNDEKVLKAVSRSNPALLILKKGIVKGKYPSRSLPSFKVLNETVLLKK